MKKLFRIIALLSAIVGFFCAIVSWGGGLDFMDGWACLEWGLFSLAFWAFARESATA